MAVRCSRGSSRLWHAVLHRSSLHSNSRLKTWNWLPILRFSTAKYSNCPSSFSKDNDHHTFVDFSALPSKLVERLTQQNIMLPNELQNKVLPEVLCGRNVVVNAETGSGKTLCYLLPILSRMYHYQTARREIPCPLAAVVVPTPELAHQVNSVYQSLAVSQWHSSVAHAESRLQLTQSTHLVILTGSTLHRYFFPRVFKELKILVFDETDMLLTGSERSTCWKLLNYFKETLLSTHVQQKELNTGSELDPFNCSSNNVSRASSSLPALMCHQFIFVGATLPARGRMTVDARIRRWAPSDSLFITTEGTHRTISEAQFEFIKAESKQEKNAALLSIFRDFENRKQGQSFSLDNGGHETTSVSDTLGGKGRNVAGDSILVFCDDETTVESVHATLITSAAYRSHRNVGKLHAGLPIHERLGVIQEFRKGKIKVLICTNILSRGLDMPNVGMVIQYDCPRNVADFLHRSGRTARLKRMGKVVCFYDGSSKPVVELIQEAIDNNEMTFDHLFSRNKMLGRKLKRRAQKSRHPRQESN